jgi:hypothetical protein
MMSNVIQTWVMHPQQKYSQFLILNITSKIESDIISEKFSMNDHKTTFSSHKVNQRLIPLDKR